MRIYDNSLTLLNQKCLILRFQLEYYQVENGFERLGMGREDEYFWKTSKERQKLEENTIDTQ